MNLNKELTNIPIICINLKKRHDKKKEMIKKCKRRKIPIKFFPAELHTNPKRGCLESHLTVIKNAVKEGHKNILILEDDAKFLKPINNLPPLPKNWQMLYLGGTVHKNFGESDSKGWWKVQCWTTHAYIINLQNKDFLEDIYKLEEYQQEVDRYYLEYIHLKYNAYMLDPMPVIQEEGFSDIEGQKVNYDFMQSTLHGFMKPEHEKVDDNYILKLPNIPNEELPCVSIVTPTYERRKLIYMAIRNFNDFIYPKEKLEWIILDDSKDSMEDIIPKDKRIHYIHIPNEHYSIAKKRNMGADFANYEYIVHMDDDDYYPPESILARIKILMKYKDKGIECVGSSSIGIYNIMNKTSNIASDGDTSLSEASMAYTKNFWKQRPFNEEEERGEYRGFIFGRFEKIMDIPYAFIIIAFTHKQNFTDLRKINENALINKNTGKSMTFYDTFDIELRLFIDDIVKLLLK
jgi:GR25 family glycosyltransferase involved in LPS biosynthesis